jgi:hypothetical protein
VAEPTQRPAGRRPGRAGRLVRAASFGLTDRRAQPVALAGFLLRGGIVLLAVPSLVVPSVIDIAGAVGLRAFTIAGQPTILLVALIAIGVLVALTWLTVAILFGSAADAWLVTMAMDSARRGGRPPVPVPAGEPGDDPGLTLPPASMILRLAGIRLMCLLPLAIAVGWAATQVFNAAYNELLTPTNLATPLPIRVALDAGDAVAIVTVVWLAGETVAAIAVRRQLLMGSGIWRSLAGALAEIGRRPISSLATAVVTYAVSFAAIGLAIVATSVAFDWCRMAARNQVPIAIQFGFGPVSTQRDFRPVVFGLAAISLGLVWVGSLALAAVTSAWRSAAFTSEVADALYEANAATVPQARGDGLGLSGAAAERSGD